MINLETIKGFCFFSNQSFLKNFFLPTPTSPNNPAPRSTSVVGSGAGEVSGPPPICATGVVEPEGEVKLDLLKVAGSSEEGQPAIPKNIITIHKTINNFFIFFLLFKRHKNSFCLS